ncbi:MAG: Cof-type HAD-IIB family hydrolase [Pseudanabaenaceae cyanobacterium]
MLDIKLVVLDIDGTIAGEDNTVSPRLQETIKAVQAKGVKVGIATGRMYRSAVRFHQAVGADVPLISYQGALIKDPQTDRVVNHLPVSTEYALRLVEDLRRYPDVVIHLYVDDQLYVQELNPQSQAYAERSQVPVVPVGCLTTFLQQQTPPTKVLALGENGDRVAQLLRDMQQRYRQDELYLTRSQARYLEATHPQANKGTAVQFLAEQIYGLQPQQVMTIGDNANDIEMVKYAGIGVAMGNGTPELKEVADWVAPPITAEGAAVALEKFLLT